DNVGDIYIAGYFRGTITFPGSTISMTSQGGTDALIAKYDGAGNLIWAKSGGGTGNDFAYGVSVKGSNVAIIGQFDLTADFSSTILNSAGSADIFLAEYNANNGNLNWVNRFGGTGADIGFSLATAGNDYVYTGQFSNSITVGSNTLTSSGNSDVLVGRVNSIGSSVWAKKAGGISQDAGRGIAVNSNGDKLFVTGSFAETANFGTNSLSSFGNLDIFVATVDFATGDFETVYQNGGTLDDEARGITAATTNTSFITGYFNGQGSFGNVDLTSAGDWDIFVHKFTLVVAPDLANGLVAWYKMNGNAQDASGNGNHGIAQNINPTADRSSAANKAYLFQQNTTTADVLKVDPVNVGGTATTNTSTYLAWLKTAPNFANSNIPKPIFSTSFDDTEYRSIQLSDIGVLSYSFVGTNSIQVDQSSTVPIQDNTWHHIAVVYKAGIEVIFYLDGNELGRTYLTNFFEPETFLGTHWNIGHVTNSDRLSPVYSFNGSLDDVRIYRRALSSAEINVIKNQSAANSLVEESNVKVSKLSPEVKMWPNPTSGKLNLDLGSRVTNVKVQILDISGTSVLTRDVNGLNDSYLSLDVQNLSVGIYFVQIDMDGTFSTQKLIISK
ncbi:MAG: LamG-like jellyroll fold domain-containing protein, partial [Bacteroidia bacterium]